MEAQMEKTSVNPGIVPINDLPLEKQLEVNGQITVSTAARMQVSNQEQYNEAANFLRSIKEQAKKVKDYWSGPKSKAAAAHKDIVNREKSMLDPLTKAENIIKSAMKSYQEAVERARREAEEEARRRQQQEAERLFDQAAEAEASGDGQAAAVGLAMAEMVSDMQAPPSIESPTAQGISSRKTWKARVTDPKLVPAYFNGLELRTISTAALNNIAKMTKGTASIPGVEFFEDSTISVRV